MRLATSKLPGNGKPSDEARTAVAIQVTQSQGHFFIPNSAAYYAVREAVSHNAFESVDDSVWPTAKLTKANERGCAQLLPLGSEGEPVSPETRADLSDRIWKQRSQLSDLDADVLDMLSAIWLARARSPDDRASAGVDQLLSMRGLKPKRGRGGCSSGYRPVQHQQLCESLSRIECLWITMSLHEVYAIHKGRRPKREVIAVQSRALVVTEREVRSGDGEPVRMISFRYRLADIFSRFLFGPGRQIALLSLQAVRYDPYRQSWEKRLARYLSWQWRNRAKSGAYLAPFKVRTLLDAVGVHATHERPLRLRERFEKALDTLEVDRVIRGWQYQDGADTMVSQREWLPRWFDTNVLIEPPQSVQETYRRIGDAGRRINRRAPLSIETLGERVRQARIRKGISQLDLAEKLSVNHNLLCMIEKGRRSAPRSCQQKLERWLAEINKCSPYRGGM